MAMPCTSLLSGSGAECSVLTCAWKAPRVMSGFHASTTQPRPLRGDNVNFPRCRSSSIDHVLFKNILSYRDGRHHAGDSHIGLLDSLLSRRTRQVKSKIRAHTRWRLFCMHSDPLLSSPITIEKLWEVLKPSIAYLSPEQLQMVEDALKLAFEAHNGQKRRSGEPFIIHPVEVACILGDLELDCESIIAGLLHDTVEDSNFVTFERIEEEFGPVVRRIVEGETKVSKLGKLQCKSIDRSVQDVKANDLRQMFLAMTEEVRVIIVKLADRLHNMRTLSHMPTCKQFSIALETLEIFAPLAKLLGMYKIKSELETLSLMYTKPVEFADMRRRVKQLYKEQEEELLEAKRILVNKIKEDPFLHFVGMDIEVLPVCKEYYSVYKTLLESKCLIDEVNDVAQLRVILKHKPCFTVAPLCNLRQVCYHILGLVHGMWTPIPRAMKDYIATPKPNGYQSLHTKIIPFLNESTFRLEIQIRTEEMDRIAERGIAVYYSGREMTSLNKQDLVRRVSWLNAIREWQDEFVGNMTSREFVDTITVDLLGSRIFVFTPKGEIKNLPKGATVIDYAYQIHTEIGNKMVAAKVNGNLVSPVHKLSNAEVVEVLTYDGSPTKASYDQHKLWLQHAKTKSARHKIMKFLREQSSLFSGKLTLNNVDTKDEMLNDSYLSNYISPPCISSKKLNNSENDKKYLNNADFSKPERSYNNLQHSEGTLMPVSRQDWEFDKSFPEFGFKFNGELDLWRKSASTSDLHSATVNELSLAGLEKWKTHVVSHWHSLKGRTIYWFSVSCIDRKGLLAEVASILARAGIQIHACVVKAHHITTVGMLVFHIEGRIENMVNATIHMNAVEGVKHWSIGCSWKLPEYQADKVLEC